MTNSRFSKVLAEEEGLEKLVCPDCGVLLRRFEDAKTNLIMRIPPQTMECPKCLKIYWRSNNEDREAQ